MTINQGDIIRTSVRFKDDNAGDIVNVFHWCATVGTSEADEDVMDEIEAKLDTLYSGLSTVLPDTMVPYDVRHDVVDWLVGKETVLRVLGTRAWTLTTPPADGGEVMPQQDALVVNMRTTLPKTFGRKYIGPISEVRQQDGTASGTILAALGTFITELLTNIVMTNLTLDSGVLTYKEGDVGHFAAFISGVVNSIFATLKSRRIKKGS